MFFLLLSHDHNTYHRRFRDTWRKWAKEVTRPFAFQPKALEMFENQYKSELLIRSHPRGRGFESLQVHHDVETKNVSCEKPEYIGLFCCPNGDFSLYQNTDAKSTFSLMKYAVTVLRCGMALTVQAAPQPPQPAHRGRLCFSGRLLSWASGIS